MSELTQQVDTYREQVDHLGSDNARLKSLLDLTCTGSDQVAEEDELDVMSVQEITAQKEVIIERDR